MSTYILRRILASIPVLILVTFGAFALIRIIPGDLAALKLGRDATPQQVQAYRQKLGLADPIPIQYLKWVGHALTGDFGQSAWEYRPVTAVVKDKFPVTLELALFAVLLSTLIGMPLGVLSAVRQDSLLDQGCRFVAIFFLAVPSFWLAVLLITLPQIWFGWKPPTTGWQSLFTNPFNNLWRLFWPALVIGMSSAAFILRLMRSTLLEVMRQDYIRTAWSKGLRERTVIMRHGIKVGMIPVLTAIGLQLSVLLGGAVIAEQVFAVPGMGRSLLGAISQRDYDLVQAYVLVFALTYLIMNLLVDLGYGYLDPRIRYR
ncbi:MAG TPA: ABC transporter permease [Dehalococcoidia bacterium]|nr:ABC transporter permease [Dehalococcoidia bacterium]